MIYTIYTFYIAKISYRIFCTCISASDIYCLAMQVSDRSPPELILKSKYDYTYYEKVFNLSKIK